MEWQQSLTQNTVSQSIDISSCTAWLAAEVRVTNMLINCVLLIGHLARNYELEKAEFVHRLKAASMSMQPDPYVPEEGPSGTVGSQSQAEMATSSRGKQPCSLSLQYYGRRYTSQLLLSAYALHDMHACNSISKNQQPT